MTRTPTLPLNDKGMWRKTLARTHPDASVFDFPRTMKEAPPGVSLEDSGVQLADLNGDGRADLLVTDGLRGGYYPLTFDGGWDHRGFVRYEQVPSVNLEAPDVKLVDLNGDGVVDALRTGPNFELYHDDPKKGWTDVELRARGDPDRFPNVSFDDPRVKLGDMSGDGLQDIVLIHNGRVEYWPYLGHGRWVQCITMENSPRFEDAEFFSGIGYDPKRVLLGVEGGVDGAGTGGALAERLLQTPFVEGVDGVAHGLGVAAQGASDPRGALAPCAGKQDLAAAEDEGVFGAQALLQGLALVFLKRTHADGFSHGAQVSTSPTTSSEEALGSGKVPAARRRGFSQMCRCSTIWATVTIFSPWRVARCSRSGTRAMVPSSFIISQITPAGPSPARRARSTAASVCPGRSNTPPGLARMGKTWPGITRSAGTLAGFAATRTVLALSAADTPVVMPTAASTGTVKAVPIRQLLCRTMSGIWSRSIISGLIGRHISPRP